MFGPRRNKQTTKKRFTPVNRNACKLQLYFVEILELLLFWKNYAFVLVLDKDIVHAWNRYEHNDSDIALKINITKFHQTNPLSCLNMPFGILLNVVMATIKQEGKSSNWWKDIRLKRLMQCCCGLAWHSCSHMGQQTSSRKVSSPQSLLIYIY